jgi:hypothetical protein
MADKTASCLDGRLLVLQVLSNIVTAFGLSASAGLNAYIPLLIVAVVARFTTLVQLRPPFDALTNLWVVAVLVILVLVEALVDKIPAVDSINNLIQTLVRPAAGAILFAASSNVVSNVHPVLAIVCGILVAGTVHAAKSTARPLITVATAGTGNPVVSTAEDVVSAAVSLLSILVPVLAFLCIAIGVLMIVRLLKSPQARA